MARTKLTFTNDKKAVWCVPYPADDLVLLGPQQTSLAYRQTSIISHTLGNKIFDHSDVVGASPVESLLSMYV